MKPSRNPFLWLAIFYCMGSVVAGAQTAPLTLRQAIDEALGQNPEIAVAHAGEKAASASSLLARTALLPQLNFTEEISRGDDPVYAFGTRLRQRQFTQADFALNALNRPQPIGNFASRFSGSWTAFDSFKTEREIRSADLFKKSSASSAQAVNQRIVFQVVKAYQSVLYAQRQIEVARHEQETAEALLASTGERVKAGLAVESDRMSAEVNVAARKEELIAAQGELELSWAELREAMGRPELAFSALKPIEPHKFAQLALEEELSTAAKARPDLIALGEAQSAQAAAVGAAKSEFGPRVSAYGDWEQDQSPTAGAGGDNWVAGVHQQTAELTLETAQAAMEQAAESLRILKNRYNAGLATITDLLRAGDAERESQSSYWRAVYGNTLAHAELLYATGTLTPDAAEDLQ
jgi:outer membrane protein TolC